MNSDISEAEILYLSSLYNCKCFEAFWEQIGQHTGKLYPNFTTRKGTKFCTKNASLMRYMKADEVHEGKTSFAVSFRRTRWSITFKNPLGETQTQQQNFNNKTISLDKQQIINSTTCWSKSKHRKSNQSPATTGQVETIHAHTRVFMRNDNCKKLRGSELKIKYNEKIVNEYTHNQLCDVRINSKCSLTLYLYIYIAPFNIFMNIIIQNWKYYHLEIGFKHLGEACSGTIFPIGFSSKLLTHCKRTTVFIKA